MPGTVLANNSTAVQHSISMLIRTPHRHKGKSKHADDNTLHRIFNNEYTRYLFKKYLFRDDFGVA